MMQSSDPTASFLLRFFRRFVSYSSVGIGTFLFDIALLATLLLLTDLHYLLAVSISFVTAVSLNFTISYTWVFRGTQRKVATGYAFFFSIAAIDIAIIAILVSFFVSTLGSGVLITRILVGCLVGILNFLINTFFNFKVV